MPKLAQELARLYLLADDLEEAIKQSKTVYAGRAWRAAREAAYVQIDALLPLVENEGEFALELLQAKKDLLITRTSRMSDGTAILQEEL